MVRSQTTCLALLLAGLLAGCSEMRWHRRFWPTSTTTMEAPADQSPRKATTSAKPGSPEIPTALYIPGSAGPATPAPAKSEVFATTSLPKTPEPETTTTLPPLTSSDPAIADNPLQALARKAAARWATIDAYACRMRRREAVGGQPRPEELLVAKFRKEPYSVYFQWLGPEAKGREVIYVQGQHGNQIHTLTAPGDVFLVPGGTHFKVAPDSLLVKNKSRYPITEAGIGPLVGHFIKLADAVERSDGKVGTVKYLGQARRVEFENKVEVVLHEIPAGWDAQLSRGGKRLWCFDPEHGLPVLIITYDEANREVEYYCYDRFEFPGRYSDDDFNPARLWKAAAK